MSSRTTLLRLLFAAEHGCSDIEDTWRVVSLVLYPLSPECQY